MKVERTEQWALSPVENFALSFFKEAIKSELYLYAGVPEKILHLYKLVHGSEPPETYELNAHWCILRGLQTGGATLAQGFNKVSTKLMQIINGVHWEYFGSPIHYLNTKILYEYYIFLCSQKGMQSIDYERFVALQDEHFPYPSIDIPKTGTNEMPPEPQEGELHLAAAAMAAIKAYGNALELGLIEHRIPEKRIVFDMLFGHIDDEEVFSLIYREYKLALLYITAPHSMLEDRDRMEYLAIKHTYFSDRFPDKPLPQNELKDIILSVMSWM